jgi:primosomal protein N' (replication factor Y) (superfamily II helicase)
MALPLYLDGKSLRSPPGSRSLLLSGSVYANVVLDLQARDLRDRLFTYKIPAPLAAEAFIGAQVLVPFGNRDLVGGFIISLSDRCEAGISIKEIAEVVEPEPFFDKSYVDFLYWLADYYCTSLSDVISAAIPANFSPRVKKIVELTERTGETSLSHITDPAARAILGCLSESKHGTLALSALRQRCKQKGRISNAHFYRAIGFLRQEGQIRTSTETSAAQAPKLISTVLWTGLEPTNKRQEELVAVLARNGGQMTMKNFIEASKTTYATIKKLAQSGILSINQDEDVRDPLAHLNRGNGKTAIELKLTDEQTAVLKILSQALDERLQASAPGPGRHDELGEHGTDRPASQQAHAAEAGILSTEVGVLCQGDVATTVAPGHPWLLHGVTGSGKTEIYLRLIDQTLKASRTVLMLVPEISLTPQLARRLTERFGQKVSVWHSSLSDGEKYDTWRRLRTGDVRVLLGARSAVLANLPDLGLIILDEEHDGSYKQTSPNPRYNAKDVAEERARREGCMVLLGSATPDVATYYRAVQEKSLLEMPNRVYKQAMPEVTIVDMRQEFLAGNKKIFSKLLEERLYDCLEKKEQAILLMNRRGFASHVFCRACGYVARCRNCSVSLVFHQVQGHFKNSQDEYQSGYLACHHCGFKSSAIIECPACQSPFIRQFGLGTQRIEYEVRELFPEARIVRLDSDVALKKGSHEEVLHGFAQGEADILIGTQMVAKGLDIANVSLVGVMAADASFNVPDYRAMERGFQLLTQVAGRTGRGEREGKVVLQTYNTDMPVLQWAKVHDYKHFVEEELAARKGFSYPPFSQLLRIVIYGPDHLAVERECDLLAEEIGKELEDAFPEEAIQVLGPAPCLLERLRGKFRFHLLIKNFAGDSGRVALTNFLRRKRMPEGLVMAVDVDALDLM